MSKGRVLITGATGIMGSWVFCEALERGYTPVVLMRDDNALRARQRLAAVSRMVRGTEAIEPVEFIHGDASAPQFGLPSAEAEALRRRVDLVIHCAACTSFSPSAKEEIWTTNLGGMEHLLRFMDGADAPLYHVSTAYVAGRRCGAVGEGELEHDAGFNNTYEQSKYESERLFRQALAAGRVQGAVFRPGIIVGDSAQGRISQFLNFYSFLRFVDVASRKRFSGRPSLRVIANPGATKNIVPVDWTARALWQILESAGPDGATYHLTNPAPPSHVDLHGWVRSKLPNVQVRLVDQFDGEVTPLENAARAAFRTYRSYLAEEPKFDMTNTFAVLDGSAPFPQLDNAFYDVLLDYARAQRWRGLFGCLPKTPDLDSSRGVFADAGSRDRFDAAAVS